MAADGEKLVHELVRLARRELNGEPPRSAVRVLPNLRRPAERESPKAIWPFGAAAAVLACVVGFLIFGRAAPITYSVVDGSVRSGVVLGAQATRLHFSEGSEVALERGAEAVVEELRRRGGTVRVRRGRARVAVAHRPGAEWTVQAGPYAVRVTGTEFDVQWSEAERTLEVAMHTGSVEVSRPSWNAPIRLSSGQRLIWPDTAPPRIEELATATLHDMAPSQAAETTERARLSVEEDTAAQPAPTPLAAAKGTSKQDLQSPTSNDAPWSRRVAQGKFDEVLADAERQGLDGVLARASLADLRALADAARYLRRTQVAERALLAQRKRFANSAAAREAAFLLGQVAEARGERGLSWYEAYLQEAPSGAYASQAFGRKMMIAYQDGGARSAEAIANEYLVRYRKGPYAAAARKIVSEAAALR